MNGSSLFNNPGEASRSNCCSLQAWMQPVAEEGS